MEGIWQAVSTELDGEEAPIQVLLIPVCLHSSQG